MPGLDSVLARSVTVLGSTGSIGVNTLDVIAHARKHYGAQAFPVTALTAGNNVEKLIEQARAILPKRAVIGDETLLGTLKEGLAGTGIEAARRSRRAVIAKQPPCRPTLSWWRSWAPPRLSRRWQPSAAA